MQYVGQIGGSSESAKIDSDSWLALIDTHQALQHVPSRMGINPFTYEPCEYKAPPSTAPIHVNGADVGTISWAMDGSPFLIVFAEEESRDVVADVAREIATALDARLVQDAAES